MAGVFFFFSGGGWGGYGWLVFSFLGGGGWGGYGCLVFFFGGGGWSGYGWLVFSFFSGGLLRQRGRERKKHIWKNIKIIFKLSSKKIKPLMLVFCKMRC